MRNRIDRYNQRSYKHWVQERIPEYFVDEEDPFDFWYRYHSLHNDYYSRSPNVFCSDCESVDSYSKKPSKNNKKSLKNRYAALDLEESYTILGEDNEQQGTYLDSGEEEAEATILTDESKKCLKTTVTDETDVEAKRQKWIDSWSKKEDGDENLWVITVDGFFRKKRKAGYGVMIRDGYGVPILASASAYDLGKPVSWFYHTLQGIDRGLELAIKYGFHRVYLFYTLPYAIGELIKSFLESGYNTSSSYDHEYKYCGFMNKCQGEDKFQLVYTLLREIEQKCCMFVDDSSMRGYMSDSPNLQGSNTKRRYNIPADYLAKLQVTKKEIKAEEFSEELKDNLYADAHNQEMMHCFVVDQPRNLIHPKGINN